MIILKLTSTRFSSIVAQPIKFVVDVVVHVDTVVVVVVFIVVAFGHVVVLMLLILETYRVVQSK